MTGIGSLTACSGRHSGSHPARLPRSAGDPIHLLAHRQRPVLVRHLVRLPADDRRLRFGTATDDALIERYVAGIDFSRDRVFGVFAPNRTLIGMAHLALDPARRFAEIGLSVEPAYRDKGYGYVLLQRAILHAANSGYRTLFMHCLAENAIMQHLARKSGLKVVTAHGEANAHIALSRQVHGCQPVKVLDGQAALIDSLFKQQLASSLEARPIPVRGEPTRARLPLID